MDQAELSWGLGLSMAVFFGLIIGVVMYIVEICNNPVRKRIRKELTRKKNADKDRKFLKSINLDGMRIVEFAELYEERLKEDFLYNEFNALLSRYMQKNLSENAKLKQNEEKNVFENHLPFSTNIVSLGPQLPSYINASWVNGFDMEKKYIITQVPIRKTINEFWRMIWQYECNIIVMMGREITNDKVIVDYTNPLAYKIWKSPFLLEVEKKQIFSDFVKRTLILHHKKKSRQIIHLQFLTWTHVSESNAQVILELRRQMKIEWINRKGRIVVHCISGCGRSGTYVAICNLCDRIDSIKESKEDERISIPYEVINMRESRLLSVANLHQYSMIYETVVHYIVAGITAIHMSNLAEEMNFLSIRSPSSGLTRFEQQFKNTNKRTRKLFEVDCAGGFRLENDCKNRIFNLVPRDCDRPYLKNVIALSSSDYINAVYVDSFNSKCHFLVTQWPMKNTINDLWRMFFDKRVYAAVILNTLECCDKYPMFWPTIMNQSVGCGTVAVKFIKSDYVNNYIQYQVYQLNKMEFHLKNSEISKLKSNNINVKLMAESEPLEVTLFHLLNWGNKSMPDNLESLIDLISKVEEYNTLKSCLFRTCKTPITIISRDGVERAGVFCVLSNCLNTIRRTGEIDVYSSVLNVKRNRPQLIPTLEEYLLCYELCLEYLILSNKNKDFRNEEDANDNDDDVDF